MSQNIDNEAFLSEIRLFAHTNIPNGWAACNGQYLSIQQNQALYAIIGTCFGGDGVHTFCLPDLKGKIIIGSGSGYKLAETGGETEHVLTEDELPAHTHNVVASTNDADVSSPADAFWAGNMTYRKEPNSKLSKAALSTAGKNEGHNNMAPYKALHYCICTAGIYPSETGFLDEMVGTVKAAAFTKGVNKPEIYLPCDGSELPILRYKDLFTVIGTSYGGDGKNTFRLPDLQGRAALNWGQGLSYYPFASIGGAAKVTLNKDEMPWHSHIPLANEVGNAPFGSEKTTWAASPGRPERPPVFAKDLGRSAALNPGALEITGGGKGHNNMMPYLVFDYYIVAEGKIPPHH